MKAPAYIARVTIAAQLFLAACNSPLVPDGPPAIEGPIVARNISTSFDKTNPTIHVKESVAHECGIIFVIDSHTTISRTVAGGVVKVGTDNLTIGRRVTVWADGPILESCPAQAVARAIHLLD